MPAEFALLCASHAPIALRTPGADRDDAFARSLKAAGEWVSAFDPELVVEFAPDHFNGFFYDVMPNFCLGAAAESVGDWDTAAGPLNVPREVALRALDAVRRADVDLDLSQLMRVDHGFTQSWEMMLGRFDKLPIVPVMVNCAAPPRPPLRRARLLGEAMGRFAATLDKRVLFVGSGGLSHDPPIPDFDRASEAQRAFLLGGRNPSPEARAAREGRIMAAAADFAAGGGAALAPDPAWDRKILDVLAGDDLAVVDSWTDREIDQGGGCGGHEIRTWVAAYAALGAAAGRHVSAVDYYAVVPEWMTGMAVVRAVPATANHRLAGGPEALSPRQS